MDYSYSVKGRALDCEGIALVCLLFSRYKDRVMALVLYSLYIRHLYIPLRSIRPEIIDLGKHSEKPNVRRYSCSGGDCSWHFDLLLNYKAV